MRKKEQGRTGLAGAKKKRKRWSVVNIGILKEYTNHHDCSFFSFFFGLLSKTVILKEAIENATIS